MKKFIAGLLMLTVACGVSFGLEIPVTEMNSMTGCNSSETENIYYYLAGGGFSATPNDTFWNNIDSLIGGGGNGSSINIRRNGVISNCNVWERVSNVVSKNDSNGALIFSNTGNKCLFKIPGYTKTLHPTSIDAQIHYTVGYRNILSNGKLSMTSKLYYRDLGQNNWTCYPNGNTVSSFNSCPEVTVKYEDGDARLHKGECLNYRVFWCGDGLVNGRNENGTIKINYNNGTYEEECDPVSPDWINRPDGKTCSASCKIVESQNPVCSSAYNNKTEYTQTSTPWLTSSLPLCDKGTLVPGSFKYDGEPRTFTWSCTSNGKTQNCKAYQHWCGDGMKNGNEVCDYKDPNEINWGNDGCDTSCNQQNYYSNECDETFYYHLRQGYQYQFFDIFHAGSKDRWLYDFNVTFVEEKDYNRGTNPTFARTNDIVNNGMKVSEDKSMKVVESVLPKYQVLDHPDVRSKNNLYIEYAVKYADKHYSTQPDDSKLKIHKECVYCDISRCGDGEIDADYGEVCDPGSEGTKVLPDGQICNSECKIETSKKGDFVIEKTLLSSGYVTKTGQKLEWKIKVTASGGYVKDVVIKDDLPPVLSYIDYEDNLTPSSSVQMKPNQPTKTNNDKHLEWETTGILNSGDSIVLLVKTKVDVMPDKNGYENVACARAEGLDEKCDKKPLAKEGEPIIKKTLIGNKTVENIGDILKWKIEITASGGDVSGFTLVDNVPVALEYQNIVYSGNEDNLDIGNPVGPVLSGKYNVYTWNVKGILKAGHKLTLVMTTKVVKMPTSEDDYKNVACVIKNGKENCDDDKPEEQGNPHLRIKKTFTDGSTSKTVKVGDEISYRIEFGNNGNTPATITSIKDFLPKNIQYKTGSIHIDRASTYGNSIQTGDELVKGFKIVDGVRIEVFGGMTLQPGGTGYIIITGIVKGDFTDNRTNFACIYLNDEVVACSDATHDIKPDDMKCENLEVPAGNLPNGGGSKDVRCTAGGKADLIEIDCGNGTTITGANKSELKGTCTYPSGAKTYSLKCTVKKDGKDYTSNSCNGSVTVNGTSGPSGPSCFIAGTKVTMADGSQKNIEDVEIGEKVLGSNGTINTVLGFHRPLLGEKELWSINGGEYFVTAEHPFMTTEGWKSLNPELTKIGMENLPVGLLKVGDTLITENGNIEIYSLDAKKSSEDTQLYNFKLDGDHTYYADNYLVHNKGGSGTPTCKKATVKSNGDVTCTANGSAYFKLQCGNKTYYSHEKKPSYTFDNVKCSSNDVKCSVSQYKEKGPWTSNKDCVNSIVPEGFEQCFNVNAGNFSIEEGEIFPFFWNMHNLEVWIDQNKEGGADWYDTIKDTPESYKKAVNNYEDYKNTNCEKVGTIAKDSMVCTFKIYGGGETKPLYTIEGPCLSKESSLKKSDLIKAWYNTMIRTYCEDSSKCYFSLDEDRDDHRALLPSAVYYIENFGSGAGVPLRFSVGGDFELFGNIHAESNKPYGEYRIVLDNVKYLQCIGDEENHTWQQTSPEDYFTPCQNNFVLTDPYTVQKTPSGNLTASTEKLSKYKYLSGNSVFSDLLNAVQTTAYTQNDNVNKAMEKFVDKYSKLAVSVDGGKSSFLQGNNIKKVPGKSIYFVAGDITINGGSKSIDNPFTIVQTSGNTTIKGNVKHNMMLLTYGNIEFKGTSCNEDQTVKGIFYAAGNLSRATKYRNNKSDARTWCTKGGLHVQGVLIGNNFNNLMDFSRSHLNDWFNKEDKKSSVMNGASVLIEYSPSIFTKSTMPPGAEDFTTALSIYKK